MRTIVFVTIAWPWRSGKVFLIDGLSPKKMEVSAPPGNP